MMAECTEKSLKELADELLNLTPESLAVRVINDSDVEWCLSELSDILAADVAPVVRCKDCKHGVYNEDDKDPYVFCQVRGCDICPMDGYCYRGSTKEG